MIGNLGDVIALVVCVPITIALIAFVGWLFS